MINKLKVGDSFIYTKEMNERKKLCKNNGDASEFIGSLLEVGEAGPGYYRLKIDNRTIDYYCFNFEVIDLELTNNLTQKNMSLLSKFKLALKDEPQKSFIKLGIMTEDEELTEDGKKLFLDWLFRNNMEQFDEEVVVPIVEDEESSLF